MKLLQSITIMSLGAALLLATPTNHEEKAIETGNKASASLLKTLGQNMKAHIEKGGVMDALNFCTTQAYPLTQKVNSELPKGVEVKRVSLKSRNPANQATEDEKEVLQSFDELTQKNEKLPQYILKDFNSNSYKYYTPLIIDKPVCLKCHGDISNNTQLTKEINETYPQDKAIGYKMNDVRGAIVVTIQHQ